MDPQKLAAINVHQGLADLFGLERMHFRQTPLMAIGAAEIGGEENADEFKRELGSDNPGTQTKHIHLIILDALPGGKGIMDQAGADTGDFVGSDAGAHAAAANRDAALDTAGGKRLRHGDDEIGVVIRAIHLIGAEILNLMTLALQKPLNFALQLKAAMVRRDSNPHRLSP
jgi:hypothetical protein